MTLRPPVRTLPVLLLVLATGLTLPRALVDCENHPAWLWEIIRQSDLIVAGHLAKVTVLPDDPQEVAAFRRFWEEEHPDLLEALIGSGLPSQGRRFVPAERDLRLHLGPHLVLKPDHGGEVGAIDVRQRLLILGHCEAPVYQEGRFALLFLGQDGRRHAPVGGVHGVIYPDPGELDTLTRLVDMAKEPAVRVQDLEFPPLAWALLAAHDAGLRHHGLAGLAQRLSGWTEVGVTVGGDSSYRRDGKPAELELMGGYYGTRTVLHPHLGADHQARLASVFLEDPLGTGRGILHQGILSGHRAAGVDRFLLSYVEELVRGAEASPEGGEHDAVKQAKRWVLVALQYFGDPDPHWRLYIETDEELEAIGDAAWLRRIWERGKEDLGLVPGQ